MVQHIQKRPTGYYFRLAIPKPYKKYIHKREIIFSLRTHLLSVARVREKAVFSCVYEVFQLIKQKEITMHQKLTPEMQEEIIQSHIALVTRTWEEQVYNNPENNTLDQMDAYADTIRVRIAENTLAKRTSRCELAEKSMNHYIDHHNLQLDNITRGRLIRELIEAQSIALIQSLAMVNGEDYPEMDNPADYTQKAMIKKAEELRELVLPRIKELPTRERIPLHEEFVALIDAVQSEIMSESPADDNKTKWNALGLFVNRVFERHNAYTIEQADLMRGRQTTSQISQVSTVQGIHTPQAIPTPASPLISEAWAEYEKYKTTKALKKWTGKNTRDENNASVDRLLILTGDIPVNAVNRNTAIDLVNIFRSMPKNYYRLPEEKRPSYDVLLNDFQTDAELLKGKTINNHLDNLKGFFRWCMEHESRYVHNNPFSELRVSEDDSVRTLDYDLADLRKLFLSNEYIHGLHDKFWKFWLCPIALFTGARLGEITQLQLDNFCEEDGIPYIRITDLNMKTAKKNLDQSVKNKSSRRKVPIHSELIKMGILECVKILREQGEKYFFFDKSEDEDQASKWFNRNDKDGSKGYREKCSIIQEPLEGKKTFHSFRHTTITTVNPDETLPTITCMRLFGHEARRIYGEHARYKDTKVPQLKTVVETIKFEMDFSHLYNGWKKYL